MSKLQLTLSCGPYEITRALIDGTVSPDGVDLTVLSRDLERIFRPERRAEVDVAEFNLMNYFRLAGQGDPITALPVFTHRRFRHGSIFVNSSAGIENPKDLIGKTVVVGGFEPAAAIWIRGILSDEYGISLDKVDWVDVFGRLGRLPEGQSDAYTTSTPGVREKADELLLSGQASAMISAYTPQTFLRGDKRIKRLFQDPHSTELDYFARTRIFPIMHVITISQHLVERHCWIAESLAEAFTESKRVALRRLLNPRALPLAFWQYALEEQEKLLGTDPWQYGLTSDNRKVLETALRYASEQNICIPGLEVDQLFIDVENISLSTSEFV